MVKEADNLNWLKHTFAPLRAAAGATSFVERDHAEQIIEAVVRHWGSWNWTRHHAMDRRCSTLTIRVRAWAQQHWQNNLTDEMESAIVRICRSMVEWWYSEKGEDYRRRLYLAWEETRT